MMAMEILAKRALNLAALFLVLIVCPESIRAQPVVTAGSRLSDTFAASTPVMNTAREAATATVLRNGKVLIAGGQDLVSSHLYNSLSSTDLYDPNTNTFAPATSTPVMNTARDLATATALRNGKVLIAAGESFVGAPPGTAILSSTELYSPGRPR
jgi:hypothetical protein